jgi:hypothetical protein
MVRHEGGRGDVSIKNNAVYLERISDGSDDSDDSDDSEDSEDSVKKSD